MQFTLITRHVLYVGQWLLKLHQVREKVEVSRNTYPREVKVCHNSNIRIAALSWKTDRNSPLRLREIEASFSTLIICFKISLIKNFYGCHRIVDSCRAGGWQLFGSAELETRNWKEREPIKTSLKTFYASHKYNKF